MSIEISEIAVRLSVNESRQKDGTEAHQGQAKGPGTLTHEQMNTIVRQCVIETLAALRMSEGR